MFAVVDHASVQCMQMLLNALALVGSNPFLEKEKRSVHLVSSPLYASSECFQGQRKRSLFQILDKEMSKPSTSIVTLPVPCSQNRFVRTV
jgi:hypothetical protein